MIARCLLAAVTVAILLLSPVVASADSVCGNGMVEDGEQCDGGICCTGGCAFQPNTIVCRNLVFDGGQPSLCDEVERCTGLSASCPADAAAAAARVCRSAAGACDTAEECDGASRFCPANVLKPMGTECRPVAKVCEGTPVPTPTATGLTPTPTPTPFTTAATVTAVGPTPDPFANCVDAPCDTAESCDGMNAACPANGFEPSTTECRPSAGDCDIGDFCSGTNALCTADLKSTVECRASVGVCDPAESCNGTDDDCPPDLGSPGTVCGPGVGDCSLSADGTPCNDSMPCTIDDTCVGGACTGNPMTCGDGIPHPNCGEECDDGGIVPGDGCSATCLSEPGLGCPFSPIAGCRLPVVPAKASIKIRDQERIGGLKLAWRWRRGAATDVAEFGDPLTATNYQLCIYDQHGLLTGSTAPAGGTCGVTNPKPCWKRRGGRGFKYADNPQSIEPGGIRKIVLKAGKDGKAEVQLHATGGIFEFPSNGGLGVPDLAAILPPLRIQVQNSTGLCFEALFSAPVTRQDPERFEDQAD